MFCVLPEEGRLSCGRNVVNQTVLSWLLIKNCVSSKRLKARNFQRNFRFWMTHILGVEPVSELGDACRLLEKIKLLMTHDKISAPSFGVCSKMVERA